MERMRRILACTDFSEAGNRAVAKAFSLADTTLVLPFDFLKLVWASLFGYLLFAEIPSLWAWIGGTIISASAFYIAYRERMQTGAPSDHTRLTGN